MNNETKQDTNASSSSSAPPQASSSSHRHDGSKSTPGRGSSRGRGGRGGRGSGRGRGGRGRGGRGGRDGGGRGRGENQSKQDVTGDGNSKKNDNAAATADGNNESGGTGGNGGAEGKGRGGGGRGGRGKSRKSRGGRGGGRSGSGRGADDQARNGAGNNDGNDGKEQQPATPNSRADGLKSGGNSSSKQHRSKSSRGGRGGSGRGKHVGKDRSNSVNEDSVDGGGAGGKKDQEHHKKSPKSHKKHHGKGPKSGGKHHGSKHRNDSKHPGNAAATNGPDGAVAGGAANAGDAKLFSSPTLPPTTPTLTSISTPITHNGPPLPGQRGVLSLPAGFALPLSPTAATSYDQHNAELALTRSPNSPKPIYRRFDSHEDDFYTGEFRAERADEMHEEQHIAERLAKMVVDSDEDEDEDEEEEGGEEGSAGIAGFGNLGDAGGREVNEEEKKDEGGGMTAAGRPADGKALEATGTAAETPGKKKKKRKKGKKKKKSHDDDDEAANEAAAAEAAAPTPITTTEAIKKLKQQEVSIGASTKVQMRRNDSVVSLSNADGTVDADGMPVINLLKNDEDDGKKSKSGAKSKKKGKGKSKALSGNEQENQRAARKFNRSVRGCVENSDAGGLADLLRDKGNHNFALEPSVLETVMKAYVVAAMFEDALYCLRNCTLPGTLKVAQTERILTCLPQNLRNSSAFTAADMINSLCIATEFDLPTQRTYFMRIARGIALEFLEEATSARDRICSAPCERLVRSSVCVVDARLRRGKKATELIVIPGHQLGVFIPDSNENRGIQPGDAVGILPYAGPYPMSAESLDRNMIEATVGSVNGMGNLVLRLQDKTNTRLYTLLTENSEGNVYRIDKLANRMGFNRQLAAAVSFCAPAEAVRDTRRPSRELIRAITAMDENIDRVMLLGGNVGRNNSTGELTSTAALCADAVPSNATDEKHGDDDNDDNKADNSDAIRAHARIALEKYGALEGLNGSQRLAVEGASTNRLTLIQGPPGTGKTAVAIRILQHWARLASTQADGSGKGANPILATSDSNIAVDNLVEGCANVGIRVVRLGRPEAIRPELLRYCMDRPGDDRGGRGSGGGNSASAFKEKMKVLKNAQVICCTCIGSGSDIVDNLTFDRVLVDEATQATEPAVLVPLTRGCRQLVLVGDHCQLPPTVLSTRAEEEGLGVPLFSRMVACGVPPFMLDTQYRMHPAISMFCSDLFYGGKLLDGVSPPERRPLAGFPWPREEFPVAFVPVHHGVEMDDGVSKLNEAEAAAACDTVSALIDGGCPPSEIAVVTPYAAQVRLIRRLTRKLLGQRGPPFVEVSSTDGFQGREKEAVVFSAVRSNDYGAVGFVSDWRRVNVSFTRARRALVVIGNDQTLRRGDPDTWSPWLQWADAHGLNMDSPGRPRGRYEPEQLRKVRGGTTAAEMLKDVLARQQAQTKAAEQQLEKAEKNAAGHIMGTTGGDDDSAGGGAGDNGGPDGSGQKTLQDDLAALANEDGCWDDSDDDDDDIDGQILSPSISRTTLATSVSGDNGDDDEEEDPEDAWDL